MTPIATVTPRLEQELRFDVLHEVTPTGNVTNLDGGKGLEVIPTRHTELLINLPPYLVHSNRETVDGWGDASFTLKYRFLAPQRTAPWRRNNHRLPGRQHSHRNLQKRLEQRCCHTHAGGRQGLGPFDVQSTLGGTFPVNSVNTLGHTVLSNTTIQVHALKQLWPEVEINATFLAGGANDGKKTDLRNAWARFLAASASTSA